jgi:hypothetical protein
MYVSGFFKISDEEWRFLVEDFEYKNGRISKARCRLDFDGIYNQPRRWAVKCYNTGCDVS